MQAPNQKFTNPDRQKASLRVGGLATSRFYPWRFCDDDGRGIRALDRRSRQFDRNVAIHESGHVVASRLLNLPVAGVTIEITASGHYGETWSAADRDADADVDTLQLVDQLSTLMPAPGEDRGGVAVELERASSQVISLLAGVEAEKLFTAEPLPNTGHDLEEAKAIAGLIVRSPRSIDAYIEFARVDLTIKPAIA